MIMCEVRHYDDVGKDEIDLSKLKDVMISISIQEM